MKHRFCAAALAAVLLLSAAPLSPAASAAFSDAEGTWAAEVIEKAEGYGLMNGYPDGTFGVGKELTRGEFVAVLCRMFGWDAASPGAPSFSDCPASHWAYSYVETALAHGVMDAGGAFRPEDYISREEMAVMLVRALGYGTLAQSLSGLELPFDDVTDNRGYVAIAYDIGMITGVADRSKLALQISFGSAGFHVDGEDRLLETTIYHPAPSTLALRLAQPDTQVVYSEEFRNPCALYTTEDGSRYKVWYENEQSVLDKVALARMFGITGVSLWRIGNIPADGAYDVWSALLTQR